jgi:hypothetical protein
VHTASFLIGRLSRPGPRIAGTAGALLIAAATLAAAGSIPAGAATATQPPVPTCSGTPNIYVNGIDNVGDRWGVAGYIRSYPVTVPDTNGNFSAQALHASFITGKGLEVGWGVGWQNQTQSYVTQPHVYATANGPREVDGPDIGDVKDFYYAQWLGNGEEYYNVQSGSSVIFSGTISTDGANGPGQVYTAGEVPFSGLQMKGYFSSLEHMWSNGSWYNWTGMTGCADPGYYYGAGTDNSMGDS